MRLARGLRSARPAGSLSGNQLSVLSLLHRGGPRTPTDIAAAERQQPQSLTRTFADLERNGLIRRTQSEEDRRQHLLEITPEGRRALGADMAVRDAWLASRLAGLTETERELLRLAGTLMERIADPPGAVSAVRDAEE
jgi:DNA-binding MarR family transcriptional regulator